MVVLPQAGNDLSSGMACTQDNYSVGQDDSLHRYQWPQDRQQYHHSDENDNRQRDANLEIVNEPVSAGSHDENVGGV